MSDENIKGYRHPGDVEIDKVMFVASNGHPIDISDIIDTINIYQNIFRHYMECEVAVYDDSKFLHNLPYYPQQNFTGGFSGTEILVISYKERTTGAKSKIYTHAFRIHTISDRQSDVNSEVYLLSGISEEAYHTEGVDVCKSLGGSSGETTENMMKSLFTNHFNSPQVQGVYNGLKSLTHNRVNKKLKTTPTTGKHKFVIPGLSVDDTIRFLLRESDCESRVPYFVFFEDSENFNFCNVNMLVSEDPIDEYWYSMTNVNTKMETDKVKDSKSITGYRVNRQFSLLDNLDNGLYKSRTIGLDILKKKKKETVYKYSDHAKRFNKLQNKVVQGLADDKEPIANLMLTRNGHDADPLFGDEAPLPKRLDQVKDIRNSYRTAIFNTALEVVIPANPNLKVGKTIKLNFPVNAGDEEGLETYDKYLTGKYLITKVRQIFKRAEMTTVIECTKDGGIA